MKNLEFSDFMHVVSEVALEFIESNVPITVEGILDYLDSKHEYPKKEYSMMYDRIYNALRNIQYKGWYLWHEYAKTQTYKNKLKDIEYYHPDETEKTWTNDYFKTFYDLGIYSEEQIEATIPEAEVFKDFIENLRDKGVLFLIAGRGTKTYRIPDYHDFCYYKYRNMLSTAQILDNQVTGFAEDGLMLPQGVSAKELDDLTEKILGKLEFKKEEDEP